MSSIAEWMGPDGEIVRIHLQGSTITAHLSSPDPRNILEGQIGFIRWSTDNTVWGIYVSDARYRGTDLALELVRVALQVNPNLRSDSDLTCTGAYLARRVNERLGTSFTDVPRPDRLGECRRPAGECMFHE